jgi:predicted transporter
MHMYLTYSGLRDLARSSEMFDFGLKTTLSLGFRELQRRSV